jgi:hypothetical protein
MDDKVTVHVGPEISDEPLSDYDIQMIHAGLMIPNEQAVEIEGGVWTNGAHTRGKHFASDAEKYNSAALMGWVVLRYSTEMVYRGDAINDVLKMIRQ